MIKSPILIGIGGSSNSNTEQLVLGGAVGEYDHIIAPQGYNSLSAMHIN